MRVIPALLRTRAALEEAIRVTGGESPKIAKNRPLAVQRIAAILCLYLGVCGVGGAQGVPLQTAFDPTGAALAHSFIWTRPPTATNDSLHAVFRRSFDLAAPPKTARLHLFAYTRYQLFVNGDYVGRGPNRFENRRPEYDTWEIGPRLRAGGNVIAVLVHRDWPGLDPRSLGQTLSRFRRHDPGFTARLEMTAADGGQTIVTSDGSWRAFAETGLGKPPERSYSSIPETYDVSASPGEWQSAAFDDRQVPLAVSLETSNPREWPVLSPRTIPLLRETEVPFTTEPELGGLALTNGGGWTLRCRQIVQAYWVLDVEADAGTKLVATPLLPEGRKGPASVFLCRAGRQRWLGGDTFALNALSLRVASGRAKLLQARLVEVIYPFERVGKFASSDPVLDRVWNLTARSLELLSEDAYTDCADRERSEWMDCDPPMYDASRVMMAGPGTNGAKVWSDPRLFANMLRRVALTQEADGMLRARTCSELVDIHTRMEDRACDWVEGLRKYYEATGDQALIRELWPYAERLLQWFAAHRTERGLVKAREWIAWDNPMSYATCEGTANNAFVQRAFADAAWLAHEIGNQPAAARWGEAADKLGRDFNRLLWDETAGAYCSAIGATDILPGDRMFRKSITLQTVEGRTEPTLHANLFALDRGVVPADRRDRVVNWMLQHQDQIKQVMANYYFFKILYGLDQARCDQIVLDRIRHGWQGMIDSPWQTTWESMGGGSKVHCYGIVPGYILSAYVLGVRRDAPVWQRQLVIEPHLADLAHAEGTVVTEFGPVPVSWRKEGTGLVFQVTVPADVQATLALPDHPGESEVKLDGASVRGTVRGARRVLSLKPGEHHGTF